MSWSCCQNSGCQIFAVVCRTANAQMWVSVRWKLVWWNGMWRSRKNLIAVTWNFMGNVSIKGSGFFVNLTWGWRQLSGKWMAPASSLNSWPDHFKQVFFENARVKPNDDNDLSWKLHYDCLCLKLANFVLPLSLEHLSAMHWCIKWHC